MRIVITDECLIWNVKNPFLKPYKDIILVVCYRSSGTYNCCS